MKVMMKGSIICLIMLMFSSKAFSSEVKVMFADSLSSEISVIQPFNDWYLGSNSEKTTMQEMYQQGWKLIEMIKLNAVASDKQFWLVFER